MFNQQQQDSVKIEFYDCDPQMFESLMAIINEKSAKKSILPIENKPE